MDREDIEGQFRVSDGTQDKPLAELRQEVEPENIVIVSEAKLPRGRVTPPGYFDETILKAIAKREAYDRNLWLGIVLFLVILGLWMLSLAQH
jgi:hypothetical protein